MEKQNQTFVPSIPGFNWLTGDITSQGQSKFTETKGYQEDRKNFKKFFGNNPNQQFKSRTLKK